MSGGDNKESSTVDHLQVVSSNIETAMDGHVAGAGQRGALTDYHLYGPIESTSLQADQSNKLSLVQCSQPTNVNVSSMDGQIAGAGQQGALTDHHLDGPHESTSLAVKTKMLLSDVTDIHSIDRLTKDKMRLTPDGCTCGEYDGDYCLGYFLSNFCIASCIALLYCFAFFMQNIFLHFAVLYLIEHAFFTFIIKANLVRFHLKIINIHCQRKIAVKIEFSLDQSF